MSFGVVCCFDVKFVVFLNSINQIAWINLIYFKSYNKRMATLGMHVNEQYEQDKRIKELWYMFLYFQRFLRNIKACVCLPN